MQGGHRTFQLESAYIPAKPWRPLSGCVIPEIAISYVFYD